MGFSNYAEQEWLKQHYRQFEIWKEYFMGQQWSIEKEQDMNKSMGHFTNWKFGVPVKVYTHGMSGINFSEGRLTRESENSFSVYWASGGHVNLRKAEYYYELIPHNGISSVEVGSPRYPVCRTPVDVAYCNSCNSMELLYSERSISILPIPEPTATLIIDGKEIELNAKCIIAIKEAVRLATGRTNII